jgi:hypothetical protein
MRFGKKMITKNGRGTNGKPIKKGGRPRRRLEGDGKKTDEKLKKNGEKQKENIEEIGKGNTTEIGGMR